MGDKRIFVFDSDGVLSSGGQALPMARELIQYLNDEELPYYILTNNPFLNSEERSLNYRKQGFDIAADKIVGAAHPLEQAIGELKNVHGQLFAVGVEDPQEKLEAWGYKVDNTSEDIDGILLLDDDHRWGADRMAYLLNLLIKRPDLPVIAPNPDLVFPDTPKTLYLTTGSWVYLLSTLCRAKGFELNLVQLGKPCKPVYDFLQTKIDSAFPNVELKNIYMLGDSPATDILGANLYGWSSILIETGNYLYGRGQENCHPDYSYKDLGEFCQAFSLAE